MTLERKYGLFLLLAIPLYLTWTFDHALWNPDETRDAGIAAEMYRTSEYIVPKLNGETFLEKPPLYYWTCAAVYTLTRHVTAGTTRLPSALFGLLGLFFTFLIGKHLFDVRTGFFAAGMLATAAQYFRMSHFATMDVALAALITGALYFYLRGSKVGFALFTILAFYTKGLLGVALPGLVVTLDCLFQKKGKEWALTVAVAAALFALLVTPWLWALWKSGGTAALKVFLIDNNWKRFSANGTDHTESPWYVYFISFPGDFLPWSVVFLGAAWTVARNGRAAWAKPPLRFVLLWFVSILLLLTLSSSKRSIYLLPIFPAGALIAATLLNEITLNGLSSWPSRLSFWGSAVLAWLVAFIGVTAFFYFRKNIPLGVFGFGLAGTGFFFFQRSVQQRQMETAILILFGAVGVSVASVSFSGMSAMDRDKSVVPVVEAARAEAPGAPVVGYDWSEMERGVFPFYLGQSCPNFTDTDALLRFLDKMENVKIVVIANRNKKEILDSALRNRLRLASEFRANKKTRSYLIYVTR